ncbi:hypothetical protein C8R46DRAFT_1108449 [Mycena filopes]|nr:hypothetical protein C8R46DRAFT_1108449 [Mycena filopes]
MSFALSPANFKEQVETNIPALCTELIFYGIHFVLFCLAISFLARRKTGGQKVLLGYTVVLFLFGTTQLVLTLVNTATFVRLLVQEGDRTNYDYGILAYWGVVRLFVFWTNNFVSDSLLLYRCYLIWGSRWRPMALPGILIMGTFVVMVITFKIWNFQFRVVFAVLAAITNLSLVVFTAGRIWWIRRQASHVFDGDTVQSRYNTALAMIIESGAIYYIFAILLMTPIDPTFYGAMSGIAIHLINIVPTLIVVRVGLGHNIQETIQGRAARTPTEQPFTRRRAAAPPSPSGTVLYITRTEPQKALTEAAV